MSSLSTAELASQQVVLILLNHPLTLSYPSLTSRVAGLENTLLLLVVIHLLIVCLLLWKSMRGYAGTTGAQTCTAAACCPKCTHSKETHVSNTLDSDKTLESAVIAPSELKTCFKLLLEIASEWQNVGVLLGVEYPQLAQIKSDNSTSTDCLREMLSVWLNQVDPSPTWKTLVDAVGYRSPQLANKIRCTQC